MVNRTGWSSPIDQASCDIWVYESEGQEVKRFEQRWGGYEIETLYSSTPKAKTVSAIVDSCVQRNTISRRRIVENSTLADY